MKRWTIKVLKSDEGDDYSDGEMKVLTMLTKKDWQSVTIYTWKSPEILWITTTPPPQSHILFVKRNSQTHRIFANDQHQTAVL